MNTWLLSTGILLILAAGLSRLSVELAWRYHWLKATTRRQYHFRTPRRHDWQPGVEIAMVTMGLACLAAAAR